MTRLLAVDLDGTLLDSSGEPHEHDVAAIRAAVAAGVRVTIVTGRLYSGTRAFVQHLGLQGAIGCADGSHLVRGSDDTTLLHVAVRGKPAATLRDTFARHAPATFVFARDAIGHDPGGEPYVDYVATWSRDIRVTPDVFGHELWGHDRGRHGRRRRRHPARRSRPSWATCSATFRITSFSRRFP